MYMNLIRRFKSALCALALGLLACLGNGCTGPAAPSQPPAIVFNGSDILQSSPGVLPAGLKVGLITNHTGHDRHRNRTLDFLLASKEIHLKALFSPEHGLHDTLGRRIGDATDAAFSATPPPSKPSPKTNLSKRSNPSGKQTSQNSKPGEPNFCSII